MKDQRVVVGGGEKLWCKNSKGGFNVRLTGEKMRERRREEREAAGK
jgi:predicted transcriptional regulator